MKKILTLSCLLFSYAVFAQPSVTEINLPQYVQGVGSANPPDDRKVPFACRMQVNGLTPNVTYRFYSLFGNAPTGNTGIGAYIVVNQSGNFQRVTSANLSVAGRYQTAVTDATGSFTSWFVLEPSSDIGFTPGTLLYWRIFLNNGNNGAAVVTRLTNPNPVTVLGWGSAANQGTGLRSTAIPEYTAKNFLFFYDNQTGSGRPVAGTFIESDGTRNLSALNADPTNEGYAPFYGDNVDGQDKTFGTIIPNNLANGVQNISEFSLSGGEKLRACSSPDGTYGALNTSNANGGLTALVLTCSPAALPVSLTNFTASVLTDNKVLLRWVTASEINAAFFEVESSSTGSGFAKFSTRVPAKGSNNTYELEDVLKPGVTYYRLKMIDIDGKYSYSNIVTVNGKQTYKLLISPNPASHNIAVSHIKAKQGSVIGIFSINGSLISMQSIREGAIQTSIDISRIPAGNYLLVFENEGKKESVKFKKL